MAWTKQNPVPTSVNPDLVVTKRVDATRILPNETYEQLFDFDEPTGSWETLESSYGTIVRQSIDGIPATGVRIHFASTDPGRVGRIAARYVFAQPLDLTEYLPEDALAYVSFLRYGENIGGTFDYSSPGLAEDYELRLETSDGDYYGLFNQDAYEYNWNGTPWTRVWFRLPPNSSFTTTDSRYVSSKSYLFPAGRARVVGSPSLSNITSLSIRTIEDYDVANGDTMTQETGSYTQYHADLRIEGLRQDEVRRSTVYLGGSHRLSYATTANTITVGANGQAQNLHDALLLAQNRSGEQRIVFMPGEHVWSVQWNVNSCRFIGEEGAVIRVPISSTAGGGYNVSQLVSDDVNDVELHRLTFVPYDMADVESVFLNRKSGSYWSGTLRFVMDSCTWKAVPFLVVLPSKAPSDSYVRIANSLFYIDQEDSFFADWTKPFSDNVRLLVIKLQGEGTQPSGTVCPVIELQNNTFFMRTTNVRTKTLLCDISLRLAGISVADLDALSASWDDSARLTVVGCTFVNQGGDDGIAYSLGDNDTHCFRINGPVPKSYITSCVFLGIETSSVYADTTPCYFHATTNYTTSTKYDVIISDCVSIIKQVNWSGTGSGTTMRLNNWRQALFGQRVYFVNCGWFQYLTATRPSAGTIATAALFLAHSSSPGAGAVHPEAVWGPGNYGNYMEIVVGDGTNTYGVLTGQGSSLVRFDSTVSSAELWYADVKVTKLETGSYTTLGSIVGRLVVDVNGTTRYIPVYDSVS